MKKYILLALALGIALSGARAQSEPATILLDALDLNKYTTAIGRPQEVGEHARLSIAGRRYLTGVHTRAESVLCVELDGEAISFAAEVGVDDRTTAYRDDPVDKRDSWAEFALIGDGRVLWHSGVMRYGDPAKPLHVGLEGIRSLRLKATGGPGHTHVDWVNARFTYAGETPRSAWSPRQQALIEQTRAAAQAQAERFPRPRINGAMRTGVRPGTPFYYPLAVSGMRPIDCTVEGLPEGLNFDSETGIISGTPAHAGEYAVQIRARNAHGSDARELTIAVGDQLACTPPIGFLSWSWVEGLLCESFIKELADAFVELGFRDAGYQYICLDDCWQGVRGADGRIRPDGCRFPNGLSTVGSYLHERGLRFGIYSSPGPVTCAHYAGTLGFEEQDVASWTAWGVDYLKHDLCTTPPERQEELFSRMGRLLERSGRSIVYSVNYGMAGGKAVGGHLWRTGGDLRDTWAVTPDYDGVGIVESFGMAVQSAEAQEPGAWNDPDMLMTGLYGLGGSSSDLTDERGCTDTEYRSQVSLWALMSAPLFFAADIRCINAATWETLTNPEVIEVNQDTRGEFPRRVGPSGEQEVWFKPMADGSTVVALFNKGEATARIGVDWASIGLRGRHTVRDLWQRADTGRFRSSYAAEVAPHEVVLLRIH